MLLSGHRSLLAAFLLPVILAGCTSAPPSLSVQLNASDDLNPDITGRPSPLVLKLFLLRSADAFNNARFIELYENANNTLGIDLINQSEFQIVPGEAGQLAEFALNPETRFIGFLAAYRDIDNAIWRTVLPVQLERNSELEIVLNRLSVVARVAD